MVKITQNHTLLKKDKPIRALTGKKKLMYETLKEQLGSVSASAKIVGIHRRTHYDWIRDDKNYKKQVEGIKNYIIEVVENALFKSIMDGSVQAQIFYLKSKGGYIETQRNVNLNAQLEPVVINIVKPIAIKDGQ